MGSREGLPERVSAIECDSRAGTRVLSAQWVRTLQNAEGVSETSVVIFFFWYLTTQISRNFNLCKAGAQRAATSFAHSLEIRFDVRDWQNISLHDRIVFVSRKIRTAEYQALAELRYKIRSFLKEGDGAARVAGLVRPVGRKSPLRPS